MAGVVVGRVVLAATGPVINIRMIQGHMNNKNTHFFFFHPGAHVGECTMPLRRDETDELLQGPGIFLAPPRSCSQSSRCCGACDNDVPRADALPPLPPRYHPPVRHVVSPGCAPDATRFGCSRLARSVVSMRTSSSDDPTQPGTTPTRTQTATPPPGHSTNARPGLCSATNRDHVNSEAMTKDQGSGGNDDADGLAAKMWRQRNHTSDYDDRETKTTTSTTATTLTTPLTRQH
ncbi:hypothetical protein EDB85DRAFT_1890370 [Lactarius pseudohatsudake]|nr:hypothetical protein EDB85DRAFT_1890370 [Lactarius pseudohatsudake]